MDWERVKVKAFLTMLPESESGWKTPITSIFRPNHNFSSPENINMCFGEITMPKNQSIYPGERKEVHITFMLLAEYKKKIKPGFKWRIQAASQYFATGEIIEVIDC